MSASLESVQVVFLDKISISPDVKAVNLSLALSGVNLTLPASPRTAAATALSGCGQRRSGRCVWPSWGLFSWRVWPWAGNGLVKDEGGLTSSCRPRFCARHDGCGHWSVCAGHVQAGSCDDDVRERSRCLADASGPCPPAGADRPRG
jgi:hypothetical protein